MSVPLLIAGIVILAAVLGLTLYIRGRYRMALTSVDEKSAGPLFFYRNSIGGVFRGTAGRDGQLALVHYLCLHLLLPVLGLGCLLRSDVNFLVVIASVFLSMKLIQKVYPGTQIEDEE